MGSQSQQQTNPSQPDTTAIRSLCHTGLLWQRATAEALYMYFYFVPIKPALLVYLKPFPITKNFWETKEEGRICSS